MKSSARGSESQHEEEGEAEKGEGRTEALAGTSTTCATSALPTACSRRPLLLELGDARLGVEGVDLGAPAVDDVDDAVDRDGRLGDVGRDDNLAHAAGRRAEHGRLLLRGEVGVEREDEERRELRSGNGRTDRLDGSRDLEDAGHEDEDVAANVARHVEAVCDGRADEAKVDLVGAHGELEGLESANVVGADTAVDEAGAHAVELGLGRLARRLARGLVRVARQEGRQVLLEVKVLDRVREAACARRQSGHVLGRVLLDVARGARGRGRGRVDAPGDLDGGRAVKVVGELLLVDRGRHLEVREGSGRTRGGERRTRGDARG